MNLKKLRLQKGLTQMEMCQRLGMSYQNYRNYETGCYKQCKPEIEKMISEILEIEYEYNR